MEKTDKKKLFYILIAIGILFVIFLIFYIHYRNTHISTDDAYIEGRIHTMAPKVAGTAKSVNVSDNQRVVKGQILLEIDPADYQYKVNSAAADLEAEKAKLFDAQAGIENAEAELEVQEASFNQATLDKNRAESLFKQGVIPQEQHEKAVTTFNVTSAQVKAARQQREKAKSEKSVREAVIKQKESALDIAKLNLSYTKIYSPSDGFVTNKNVEVGNQLQKNQPVMAIVDLKDIWLVANYKETQLKNVRAGQPVKIKVDTYPGTIFKGEVESIMAGTGAIFSLFPPENALGNYVKVVQRIPVKIVFEKTQEDGKVLRVGMSCMPTIYTKGKKSE